VLVGPVIQLIAWAVESVGEGAGAADLLRDAVTSLSLASIAALLAAATATVIVYGRRTRPSRSGALASRLGALGYAVPGTVVAVAVYTPLAWLDRRLADGGRDLLGVDLGLLFTGTILGLIVAYVVRFLALALFSVDSRMRRVDPALDDAARSLGADANRVLADVHLPLLWPGIVTAALLVFVEAMKELPATALLRPLGGDTLAVAVWEATRDSRFEVAALPALLIVAVGLVPVLLAIRSTRSDPAALIGPNADGSDQRSDLEARR
jgi:iron(III) transport system permease protein